MPRELPNLGQQRHSLTNAGRLFAPLVVASLLCTACSEAGKSAFEDTVHLKDFNVVYIVVDTLRADHVGCLGYARDTTPHIDSLAEEGILFERAFSTSSFTPQSALALLSGRMPSTNGTRGWVAKPAAGAASVGALFANTGYRTGFFNLNSLLKDPRWSSGFTVAETLGQPRSVRKPKVLGKPRVLSKQSPLLTKRALEFAAANKEQRFMMYLHYLDPHAPYEPPKEYYLRFSDTIYPEPLDLNRDVEKRCEGLIKTGFGEGDPRYEDLVLRYDAEIRHTDDAIGELVKGLRALGVLKNTLIVLTSDHGEEFLEHGGVSHGKTVYTESIHVPLLFWAPSAIAPARIAERVSLIDLPTTILHITGIPYDQSDFDGESLLSGTENGIVFKGGGKPVIAELLTPGRDRRHKQTIIDGDWKLNTTEAWDFAAQGDMRAASAKRTTGGLGKRMGTPGNVRRGIAPEELFNLADDAREQFNLVGKEELERVRLRGLLMEFRDYSRTKAPDDAPQTTDPLSEDDMEDLKALGYLD